MHTLLSLCLCLSVCLSVCRERERDRQTDRQREGGGGETDRQTDRQRERESISRQKDVLRKTYKKRKVCKEAFKELTEVA